MIIETERSRCTAERSRCTVAKRTDLDVHFFSDCGFNVLKTFKALFKTLFKATFKNNS